MTEGSTVVNSIFYRMGKPGMAADTRRYLVIDVSQSKQRIDE